MSIGKNYLVLLSALVYISCCGTADRQYETVDDTLVSDSILTVEQTPATPIASVAIEEVKQTPKAPPSVAAKSKATLTNKGKGETIYVETEGAQGRVWGHVTMRGDRGSGTIHDWDENTWTVSVTKHGDELYAVDQNSRLYVFKLKK